MRPSAAVVAVILVVGAVLCAAPAAPYELPPSDTGLGFFFNTETAGGAGAEAGCMIAMADAGCNTLTIYFRSAEDIRRQVDGAILCGLLKREFPVMLIANVDKPLDSLVKEAKASAHFPQSWPEFVRYGPDEPEPLPASIENLKAFREESHGMGFRWGTSICNWDAPWVFGSLLDVAIVHVGSYTPILAEARKAQGLETWAYTAELSHENLPMVRYHTGLWRWKCRPGVLLVWAYDDGVAAHTFRGTTGLEVWREGAIDYRILRALDNALIDRANVNPVEAGHAAQWLQKLKDSIQHNPWDGIAPDPIPEGYSRVRDAMPRPANFDSIRRQAVYYLNALTGCGLDLGETP